MDFRGLWPHRPDELEDQCCRHHTRRYGAYDRDNTPGDCWEARSSLLGGRQREPSGAAEVIDYAYHKALYTWQIFCMTSRVYRKTVALGPIVKIAGNAGAATRV
jgi:hypothetical protein